MCVCVCVCVCLFIWCMCVYVCVRVCMEAWVWVCMLIDSVAVALSVRYCPTCQEHREATKQMSVWRLPDVLVLHLKRFSQQNMVIRGKLDKFVRFPTRCVLVCVPHWCKFVTCTLLHTSAPPPLLRCPTPPLPNPQSSRHVSVYPWRCQSASQGHKCSCFV